MAQPRPSARLRLSARSVVLAVGLLGLTLVGLALLAASARVVGWVVAAAVLAGLLHPLVAALSRHVPRGVALAIVVAASLASVALISYVLVDDVAAQLRELERALPDAARDLERSRRFGDAAQELRLAERAEDFVDQLPERLRGGEVQDAIRSAATRGLAFLATTVLTIFFLIHGPRMLAAGVAQLHDHARRQRVARVGARAYRRAWLYVAGSLTMAATAGLIAYACAAVTDVPGKAPLALWMALFDVVPLLGAVVGGLPLVLLVWARAPGEALVVALVLAAWQLVQGFLLQTRVERRSLHVGPFLTIGTGMVGLELYGIGGAVVGLVLLVVALAVLDELVPDRASTPSTSSTASTSPTASAPSTPDQPPLPLGSTE